MVDDMAVGQIYDRLIQQVQFIPRQSILEKYMAESALRSNSAGVATELQ